VLGADLVEFGARVLTGEDLGFAIEGQRAALLPTPVAGVERDDRGAAATAFVTAGLRASGSGFDPPGGSTGVAGHRLAGSR
jgi:hypothetical protein